MGKVLAPHIPHPCERLDGMKKFLLLPIVLAAGFGILILLNSESPGNNKDKKEADEEGFVTTESGLKYKDLNVGDGKEAQPHDRVVVHYTGTLKDGTKFDSSVDRGQPAEFSLDEVVQGWSEGIPGMKVGGKRKLIIPPELGYGGRRKGNIPPNSVLFFEVELLDVK
jgi:FKBP-type peptidyl-prolyl cis-trans isomerase